VPTAKELSSVAISYSTIRVQWIPAFDPNRIISGYEVTWNVLEDDKGEHVINSPIRSSGVIPADATTYTIRDLSTSRITVLILSIITIIELIENKSIGETCGNYSFRTWNDLKFVNHYRYLLFFRFYLAPYTLYKIYLIPQWQGEIRGDIPETQSRTLEGKFIHTNQRNIAKCPQVKCLSPFDL
jgi:hypothetical protein